MAPPRKAGYRDHAPALQALTGKAPPTVVLIHGTSEYLLAESVRTLREQAVAGGAVVTAVEATALTEATLAALSGQASLFEPATFYLLRRCEQAKGLPKLLKLLPKGGPKANQLCFVYRGESPPAPLRTELDRLGARTVPCFDPWPSELPQAIQATSARLGVKLAGAAVQLLTEAHGADLVKHHNELSRLALALGPAGLGKPLSAQDLAPHLGMLREDDAFQLDRLLLARQWTKAHALVSALLQRGEKGLALLAILAGHCRTTLKVSEALARGASPGELASAVRLPPFVVKTYAQALGRGVKPANYERALGLCQNADVRMKSGRIAEELLLGRVIEELAGG